MKLPLKKILKRLRRKMHQFFRGLFFSITPEVIALPLTAQCNHRCRFCEIVGVDQALLVSGKKYCANELSFAQIKAFDLFLKSASEVDFGGLTAVGEPLLARDFIHIINYIREVNPRILINITTNAVLLGQEQADFLLEKGNIRLTFSLHAITQETYQCLMGHGFEKVLQNIKYICSKKFGKTIQTAINFGIGKLNYGEAESLIRFAREQSIDIVHIYPYYKSPNAFVEEVSLYGDSDLANSVLDNVYALAKKLGQQLSPAKPAYVRVSADEATNKFVFKSNRCQLPLANFILKADPYRENMLALCACNRIVLFQVDMTKPIEKEDLLWAWNHPIYQALRFNKSKSPICSFCTDPQTPSLRSLNHTLYKELRDKAVFETLAIFQMDKHSPNKSIELLSENIYAL